MIGSVLVIVVIFLFLRNFRSTLIVAHVDPDLGDRHLRPALLLRADAEHDDLRRPRARRRHGGRRGHRRARELVPAHGAPRQGPADGLDRRQRRGLVGDSVVDPHAHRGVRPAALPDRRVEHHVPAAVGRRRLLAADVAVRRGHAGAGALLEAARPAAAGRQAERPRRPSLHLERARARRDGRRLPPPDPSGAGAPADGDRA